MADLDPEDVSRALGEAIQSALPGEMATRWVVVVETVDVETGERALWTQAPEGQKRWDTLGLVEYCKNVELAAQVADRIQNDD